MIFVYGTFFPEDKVKFEVNYIIFAGDARMNIAMQMNKAGGSTKSIKLHHHIVSGNSMPQNKRLTTTTTAQSLTLLEAKKRKIISRKQTQFRGWSMEWHAHTC